MIIGGFPGLAIAYVLPALLAFGIAFRSSWQWPVKASALTLTACLYLVTLLSIPQLLGWPTEQPPPGKFRLVAAQIHQPDKATRDPGAIDLWVTDAGDLASAPPPRAYRFPYSGPMHEAVTNATAKLQSGMSQLGEFTPGTLLDFGPAETSTQPGQAIVPLKFYDMPDPLFPDK